MQYLTLKHGRTLGASAQAAFDALITLDLLDMLRAGTAGVHLSLPAEHCVSPTRQYAVDLQQRLLRAFRAGLGDSAYCPSFWGATEHQPQIDALIRDIVPGWRPSTCVRRTSAQETLHASH